MKVREMKIIYNLRDATEKEEEGGYLKRISSSGSAMEFFKEIVDDGIETFMVLFLNAQNQVILKKRMTEGTVNSASPFAREIFKVALLCEAASIICGHNHPSGNPRPSPEDKTFTDNLKAAGNIMQIKLLDHIIVGRDLASGVIQHCSFAEEGRL